jgi:hypothetical protein
MSSRLGSWRDTVEGGRYAAPDEEMQVLSREADGGQGRNRTAAAGLFRARAWKLGVTSESQNSPVSTNGVNSGMTQSVRILRKIKKGSESGVKQQGL